MLLTFMLATICAGDRKSTRLNSSHEWISYAVFCLKKKKNSDSLMLGLSYDALTLKAQHDAAGQSNILSIVAAPVFVLLIPIFDTSFFFNDPATSEIYTLSLHDALPI